ncbi:MAG TPA: CarD family transcriptional regulator, partial [Paracoccaceae bacterium]|nr:CarD family transcriptional regulator [Paracoccaceae bacterium]
MKNTLENSRVLIGGAPEGFDGLLLAQLVERADGPIVHVARSDTRLAAVRDALAFFAPQIPVLEFPAWDCLPYDRISPNHSISAARMATLATLADGFDIPAIILTTVNAAMQRVPAREIVRQSSFTATVGKQVNVDALRSFLVRMGFSQAPTVTEPGDYAVRGGLIDIFPPGATGPVRLDLFGDVLDGARRFDATTQRTLEKIGRIELAPVSEVILDEAAIQRFRQNYRHAFGAAGSDDPLYEAVSAGRKHQGIEHWVPFFHEHMETLFDFLPGAPVVLDEQLDAIRDSRWESIADQYDTRATALKDKSRLGSVYKPVEPASLYLDDTAWDTALQDRPIRQLSHSPQHSGPGVIDAGGRVGRNFAPERLQENISLFGAVADHLSNKRKTSRVVLACYSEGSRDRFATMLHDAEVENFGEATNYANLPKSKGALSLVVWGLESGFETNDLTVLAEQDILGDRLIRAPQKRKRAENFLTEAQSLTPGDLIVHIEHGIGRYNGLETITAAGAPHECIALEYAGGDRLYLPVENIELLTRYGNEIGMLDKLGGGAWQAKKAKLKERIREMADKLIRIA